MRDDLKAALAELESKDRKAFKVTTKHRVLGSLESNLGASERVFWVQPGTFISNSTGEITADSIHSGLVVLTDQRLVIASTSGSANWPLREFSGVTDAKPMGGVHKARVAHKSGPLWFAFDHKVATGYLLGTLEASINAATKSVEEPKPTGDSVSISEQLEKLADLHQQGALNDAEFAAAKAQILSP